MSHPTLAEIVAGQHLVHTDPKTKVSDAVRTMQHHRYSCLPVLDGGSLVGIFTSTSYVRGVLDSGLIPSETSVGDVMTRDPKTLPATSPGIDAVKLMENENIRHVVVTGCSEMQDDTAGYAVVTSDDFPPGEIAEIKEELEFEQRLWEEL